MCLIFDTGETAVSLGRNVEFIEKVADLCDCQIHAGVAGEANRYPDSFCSLALSVWISLSRSCLTTWGVAVHSEW